VPTLARDDVVARFCIDRDLGLCDRRRHDGADATESVAAELAQALCDLIRLRYGSASRAQGPAARPGFAVPALKDLSHGAVEWHLAPPTRVSRTTILQLEAFAALGTVAKQQGISSLVVETTIPPMALGTVQLDVAANLPARRVGVFAVGVDVIAQPRPPVRPDTVVRTALFSAPADKARLTLQLAPERRRVCGPPLCLAESPTGPQRPRWVGTRCRQHAHARRNRLPVEFVPVEASDDPAVARWMRRVTGRPPSRSALSSLAALHRQPRAAPNTVGASSRSRRCLDGAGKAVVSAVGARPMRLSLAFPEFGSHSVTSAWRSIPMRRLPWLIFFPRRF
jgi:hypothetical protein